MNQYFELAEQIAQGNLQYPYANEKLTSEELHTRIAHDAITHRAEQLASHNGPTDIAHSQAKLEKIFKRLAFDKDGNKRPIKNFEKDMYAIYGSVFTGHPVTNMSLDMAGKLSNAANARAKQNPDTQEIEIADTELREAMKEPFTPPTLDSESAASLAAIKSVHQADDEIIRVAMKVAQEIYPDEWSQINYMPTTIATWIPFDWDGRADVEWNQLMEKRIELQVLMLDRYTAQFEEIMDSVESERDKLTGRISLARIKATRDEMAKHQTFFKNYDHKNDPDGVKLDDAEEKLKASVNKRLTSPDELIMVVNQMLENAQDTQTREKLVLLRSKLTNHGLSFAQVHFRINAKSLIAALGEEGLKIDPDLEPEEADKQYFELLSKKIDSVKTQKPSLSGIRPEQQTSTKLVTMIGVFDELIESGRNTRFLIAETDRAIVPATALYFAKKYGIENKISISGLCEDRAGQDNYKRLTALLFTNPHYIAHMTMPRDNHPFKMAWEADQYGFSDSGCMDGVPGAGAHMERVHGQKLKLLSQAIRDNPAVSPHLISFDTGGQYPGRGYHRFSAATDQRYKQSGFLLHLACELGTKVTSETSYQGMDGNAYVLNPDMALAHITQRLDYLTDKELHAELAQDPYYKKDGLRDDFFAFYDTVREKHAQGITEKGYVNLIDSLMGHAYTYGSRPAKRAKSSGGDRSLPRAIVHNATLKRSGVAFNLLDGIREAIQEDPTRFERLMTSKNFMDMYIPMIQYALEQAMPSVVQAEVELYNPQFWEARGQHGLAKQMKRIGSYEGIKQVADRMTESVHFLSKYFEGKGLLKKQDSKTVFNRQVLQGTRIAAMIALFERAIEIPEIHKSHDLTRPEAIDRLIKGDATVIDELREIYKTASVDGHEVGYDQLHHEVFDPAQEAIEILRQQAHILAHYDCAVG
jgi:phosphoenolpyruvate carboxylase